MASAEDGDPSAGTFCTARVKPGEGSIVRKRARPGVEAASVCSSAGTHTAELAASAASLGLSCGRPLTMVNLRRLSRGIWKRKREGEGRESEESRFLRERGGFLREKVFFCEALDEGVRARERVVSGGFCLTVSFS